MPHESIFPPPLVKNIGREMKFTLEKILKIYIEGHRMEIVWTFIGNRMDFGYP